MQFERTLKFHLTLHSMVMLNPTAGNTFGDVGKGKLHSLLLGLQTAPANLEISEENIKKLKINLPSNPATPLLVVRPKDWTSFSTDTCHPCSLWLYLQTRERKQPKCPPTDKWMMEV